MRIAPLVALLCTAIPSMASEDCREDAMIVFDGSGSMAENGFNNLDEPRIFEARRAVREAMPPISKNRRLGLVVYGPGGADECSGVKVEFGPSENAAPQIIATVDGLQPAGDTALTSAVMLAAEVLDYRNKPAALVLVTDGKETCGGMPCQLAAELAVDGADLTVHVIGFKVRGDFFSWGKGRSEYMDAETPARCMAERTGGIYVRAETVDDLIAAFRKTIGCQVVF